MEELSVGVDIALPVIKDTVEIAPMDIDLSSIAVEIAMHPTNNIISCGTIDGPVKLYSYTAEESKANHKLMSFHHHKQSCRAVMFSSAGDYLFTGSSDTTISAIDLNVGAITRRLTVKDGSAIYCLLSIDHYLLASGDDDGRLIVWDFRRSVPILSLKPCEEYISCLAANSDKSTLFGTSGEGSISSFDLRARKIKQQSELFSNEFLTLAITKNDSKLVLGASDGALNIFNSGDLSTISDRFPFHSGSVDAIVSITDDMLIAGCEDGNIRAVHIHPNENIGIVANHDDIPVEGLSVSHDKKYVASCSYDRKVKFHNLSVIRNVDIKPHTKPCKGRKNTKLQSSQNVFFKELG